MEDDFDAFEAGLARLAAVSTCVSFSASSLRFLTGVLLDGPGIAGLATLKEIEY